MSSHRPPVSFDNSAGSWPKPPAVSQAVQNAIRSLGGNPGRGGHELSIRAAEAVYRVREQAARFFGAEPQNTAFTPNCTYALNMAVKGLAQFGGHVIISDCEHNGCARPVYALSKRGVPFSILHIKEDIGETLAELTSLLRPDTRCVCCMAASNVTGRLLPFREIGKVCQEHGIPLVVDAAQAAGYVDVTLGEGVSFICSSGQKGLYGPTGTGILASSGEFSLSTIVEGGTGATSQFLEQTPYMPERLESGSLNVSGIMGLGAGLSFVSSKGTARLRSHGEALCSQLEEGLKELGAEVFDQQFPRTPITAFRLPGQSPEDTAQALSRAGFALRAGLHCAPLMHHKLGTLDTGLVRFSPGAFNSREQVSALLGALKRINGPT